jgi:hypothetical protein
MQRFPHSLVMPAKAGIQRAKRNQKLDASLCGHDKNGGI